MSGKVREYQDIDGNLVIRAEVIPIKCSLTLKILGEEKEFNLRPDQILIRKEEEKEQEGQEKLLVKALKSLTKRQHECLFLSVFGGLSTRQIAKRLNLRDHKGIRQHIELAKKKIKKYFKKNNE